MAMRPSWVWAVAFVALVSTGSLGAAAGRKPVTHHVTIEGMAFVPATVTVAAGDTIVWTNKDPFPHSVTAQGFDSQAIAPGKTWTYRAARKGDFPYACTLHPTMKGTLRVK
jgi:plastocyanin